MSTHVTRPRPHRHRRLQGLVLGLILLILAPGLIWAAPVLPLQQAAPEQTLTPYLDVLQDGDSTHGPEQILDGAVIHRFAPAQDPLNPGAGPLWLRFALRNSDHESHTRWLAIRPNDNSPATLYELDTASNRLHPYGTRLSQDISPTLPALIPITVPPQSTRIYYLQMHPQSMTPLSLALVEPNGFFTALRHAGQWMSLTLGALLTLALGNWLIAVISRSTVLLCHFLYLLALFGLFASQTELLPTFFGPREHWQEAVFNTLLFLACGNAIHLAERLLRQSRLPRPWQHILGVALVLNLAAFTTSLLLGQHKHMLALFGVNNLVLCLACFWVYQQHQDRYCLGLGGLRLITLSVMFGLFLGSHQSQLETTLQSLTPLILINLEALLSTMLLMARGLQHYRRAQVESQVLAIAEAEAHSQGELLNRLSHDIRTPISGVMGMSELLLDTPLTATQRDYVETVQSSGQALLDLVNEVLDHSRLDVGNVEIKQVPFELSLLVNDCIDNFRMQAESRRIELLSDIAVEVPGMVSGDNTRLRQILMYLLRNAFQRTEKGEILLTLRTDFQRGESHIRFAIHDTGPGLSPSEQDKLFTPELGTTTDRKTPGQLPGSTPGQGLTLAVMKRLIQRMRGEIGVISEVGQGCEFWFSLPLPGRQLDTDSDSENDVEKVLREKRMIVVDDNLTCRKLIQQQATVWGMQVSLAQNGNEALAQIRAKNNLGEPYDIAIVDHDMPGMNGLQLAGKINEDNLIKHKPIVFMLTGLSKAPNAEAARLQGIRRILTKPVTGKALKITLAEELNYQNEANRRQISPGKPTTDQDLLNTRILVAEDNPVSQKVIVSMLRKLGASCRTVNNGKQALEALQREAFDLVLMDCEMPIMDGFEASKAIRGWEQESGRKAIPIIALTAHIMDEHKERSLASGMNAHLAKPVEMTQLQNTLRRWLLRQA